MDGSHQVPLAIRAAETIRPRVAGLGGRSFGAAPALLAAATAVLVGAGILMLIAGRSASRMPAGLAKANGRIEITRVDIAARYPGRVAQILVREGDFVNQGDVIARMNISELSAQLAAARATVRRAVQSIVRAEAEVVLREAEHTLSEAELKRATELERRAVASTANLDKRKAQHAVAEAHILAAKAAVGEAVAAKAAAEAEAASVEATRSDMTLKAPTSGRIEYRLVQPGAVVAAGARAPSST